MFRIQSIVAKASNYIGDHAWVVEVTVIVEAKAWTKLRDKRDLGMLYGVDIGNAVYRRLLGVSPTVALVNEQAYSGGLVGHYLDAGYEALLMDWDNPAAQ